MKFGDTVFIGDSPCIIYMICMKGYMVISSDDSIDEDYVYTDSEITRLPSCGESITVSDDDGKVDLYVRTFLFYDHGAPYPFIVTSECGNTHTGFKYIVKDTSRKQKIVEIMKRLNTNDPLLYEELAEIILSAREKIKES